MSSKDAPLPDFVQSAIDRITDLRGKPDYKPNPLDGELTEDYPGQVSEQERIKKMTGDYHMQKFLNNMQKVGNFGEKLREAITTKGTILSVTDSEGNTVKIGEVEHLQGLSTTGFSGDALKEFVK